jgi:hypothetical protein
MNDEERGFAVRGSRTGATVAWLCNALPTKNYKLSTKSYKLTAIGYKLSTKSYKLTAIGVRNSFCFGRKIDSI